MSHRFRHVYHDMDTWDTQLPDDEDRDGSQNIILLNI